MFDMASQLVFGGIAQRIGAAGVAIDRTYEMDSTGEPWLMHSRWDIDLRLVKTVGGPSLDAQVLQLDQTFGRTRSSVYLRNHDGSTSAYASPANILGGVRVVKPLSFAKYTHGEMVTYRSCTVSLEFTRALYSDRFYILDFTEEVSVTPAGPIKTALQPNVGEAVIQTVRTQQHSIAQQSGTITFLGTYGQIPPALLNGPLVGPVQYSNVSPRRIGRGIYTAEVAFTRRYAYSYIAPQTMNLLPTRWN
jgi:hypothetical protein